MRWVAGTVVHVIKLRELAELVIQKVLDATKATSDAVDLGALRPSLGLAHDALDKSEVLTGGVSDRQEGKAAPQKWDHLFDGLHGPRQEQPSSALITGPTSAQGRRGNQCP